VARVLFARVGTDLVRRGLVAQAIAEPLSYDDSRTRLGYTVYEQAMIVHELLKRFSAPPFTAQSDQALRLSTWRERAEAADRLLQRPGSRDALATLYEQALTAAPDDWVLARNFGMALVAQNGLDRAVPWLEKARDAIDDDPDTLFALATALRATGNFEEADAALAALRKLEPRYPGLAEP
jgi:tetratricopeptide (TPR) repeat protein